MISEKIKTVYMYVIPSIFSGLGLYICTIADGIIVGRFIGTDALGALSIAMSPALMVASFYVLIVSGGSACAAVMFGSGDDTGANKVFMHALIFNIAAGVLFTLAGTLFSDRICALLGASDTFLKLSSEYLFWIAVFAIPIGLSTTFSSFVKNDGSPILCSIGIIASAVGNVFLDLLFIRLFGWKTAGAAASTGISQVISAAIIFTHFLKGDGKLRLHIPQLNT
ncbi:MAG: polysaccharide biosynthesis C-terminal domain-containing protein [Synergistes sp.]|nr:polysaccharide biosynthesis C-terminal domain-containing protein [Synergistes sp.]